MADLDIMEIEEELRMDRLKALWDRFGRIVMGVIGAVVLVIAFYQGWNYWRERALAADAEAYYEIAKLERANAAQGAIAEARTRVLDDSGNGYRAIVMIEQAEAQRDAGEMEAMIQTYEALASDKAAPAIFRETALLALAYQLMDDSEAGRAAERVAAKIAAKDTILLGLFKEWQALFFWQQEKVAEAYAILDELSTQEGMPSSLQNRAGRMAEAMRALKPSAIPAATGASEPSGDEAE